MIVALIQNGIVVGVQQAAFPDLPLAEQFHAELNPTDVTNVSPQPQVGWSATEANGAWTFSAPPPPPAPTLAQQAATALAAGCQVTSTSTPALDGTYRCDATTQQHIMAEMLSIMVNNTFADGSASLAWDDATGAAHTFTVAQFKAFATAIAAYVAALLKIAAANTGTLPSQPVTIA